MPITTFAALFRPKGSNICSKTLIFNVLSAFYRTTIFMKILVCISQTPDTTAKISFTADGIGFNSAGVQFIMNPYDEWYALVRACELREAGGGTVVALNVGPAANETTIRKALAIGACVVGAAALIAILASSKSGDQAHDDSRTTYNSGKSNPFDRMPYLRMEGRRVVREHLVRNHGAVEDIDPS